MVIEIAAMGNDDGVVAEEESSDAQLVAERLNRVWNQLEVDRGRHVPLREVIGEIYTQQKVVISMTYLNNLRNGKASNPSLKVMRALRHYFQIPLDYFVTEDEHEAAAMLVQRNSAMDPVLASIINEAYMLGPAGRDLIRSTIVFVRQKSVAPDTDTTK